MSKANRTVPGRLFRTATVKVGVGVLYIVAVATVWELVTFSFSIPRWLVASPSDVCRSLLSLPRFYLQHAGYTASCAAGGLIASVIVGTTMGAILGVSSRLSSVCTPLLLAVNTFPIVAIAPLLTVMLGYGMASKIAVSFLICWIPVVFNTSRGFASTPDEFKSVASICAMSSTQRIWYMQLPFAMPFVSAGVKIAAPASVAGAVIGEFSGSRGLGLGTVILSAGSDIGVDRVYTSLVLLAVIGGGFFLVVALIDRWVHGNFSASVGESYRN